MLAGMTLDRRTFLKLGSLAALEAGMPGWVQARPATVSGRSATDPDPADYTLHIGRALIELAPDHIVSTVVYNGQFPGPLLRFKEGRSVVVDIHNDTDTPEQLHWHGQFLDDAVDGAAEERTPFIPAHGMRRETFVPGPASFRFYHTHVRAGADLSQGQYSGQVGPVYIEPKHDPGAYDREVFLTLKEFDPFFSEGGDTPLDFLSPATTDLQLKVRGEQAMRASLAAGAHKGYEVGYQAFAINGRMLGSGEPIRVKRGERVLLHVLNGSATEIRSLALPGHSFQMVALDGNPVPRPARVPVLWIGTAERVSAIVEMDHPGVWILGDLNDDDRKRGMGLVVEYAGATGKPAWQKPPPFRWDYRRFAQPGARVDHAPDETIDLLIAKDNAAAQGFNRWTINGVVYDNATMPTTRTLQLGKRYRLRMRNASDDIHPMHLHRHTFEITSIAGQATAGVRKDVAMLGGYQTMEVDFTADQPGLSLLHCHMQLHMDFGFMALFNCA